VAVALCCVSLPSSNGIQVAWTELVHRPYRSVAGSRCTQWGAFLDAAAGLDCAVSRLSLPLLPNGKRQPCPDGNRDRRCILLDFLLPPHRMHRPRLHPSAKRSLLRRPHSSLAHRPGPRRPKPRFPCARRTSQGPVLHYLLPVPAAQNLTLPQVRRMCGEVRPSLSLGGELRGEEELQLLFGVFAEYSGDGGFRDSSELRPPAETD